MLNCYCYNNKEDFLKDFQETKEKYPDFPSEEKVLQIYHAMVEEFENKEIITPEIFENHIMFKLALGIDYRTTKGLDEIDKIKKCEVYLTKEQLFLVSIPVKALLISPYMRSKYRDDDNAMTYTATANVYARWVLLNILEFKYTKIPNDGNHYSTKPNGDNCKIFNTYLNYLSAIIFPERNGGLDAIFLRKEME